MNIFGTDGIRNKVGNYPFTSKVLPQLGRAIALWALEKYGHVPDFLVARDTRISGSWVQVSLASGLLRSPVIIYDAQVLPTPAVFHLMKDDPRYTCGIIISASHNPAQDNGIKIIDRQGKITQADEERITELMEDSVGSSQTGCCGDTHGSPGPEIETNQEYHHFGLQLPLINGEELYDKKICSLFKPGFLKNQTIVLDCAQGATSTVAPAIFNALGAQIIAINNTPTGYNINKNCGALHPESLQAAVIKHSALVGFAFDGDGDRVIAVSKDGTIKDGDDVLALLCQHPDYKNEMTIVSTIMANQGFEAYLQTLGKSLIRTPVGDKYVVQELITHDLLLGGEPSGHTILRSLLPTGDGILVALKIVETMLLTGNSAFQTFTKFPQVILNVPIKHKKPLTESPIAGAIKAHEELVPQGRVLVRYSGTEPILRVMVEDSESERTTHVAHKLAEKLKTLLS